MRAPPARDRYVYRVYQGRKHPRAGLGPGSFRRGLPLVLVSLVCAPGRAGGGSELELELTQTHMTQKPMLRVLEVEVEFPKGSR